MVRFAHLELTAVTTLDHSLLCGKQKLLKRDLCCASQIRHDILTAAVIARRFCQSERLALRNLPYGRFITLISFFRIRKQTIFSRVSDNLQHILTVCRYFISLIHTHIHCLRIPEAIHQKDHLLFYFLSSNTPASAFSIAVRRLLAYSFLNASSSSMISVAMES